MKNPINAYRTTDIMTANRETILLMMYAGAIRFAKQAIAASEQGQMGEMSKMILKVQEIVNELRSTLNFEVGGEIAKSLEMLYAFITQRLLQANLDRKPEPLREALKVLETLNEAWEQAIESLKKDKSQLEKAK